MTGAAALADLFVVDRRAYGIQLENGGYTWRHAVKSGNPLAMLDTELSDRVLDAHLAGHVTVGAMVQNGAGAKALVWDYDPPPGSLTDVWPLWTLHMLLLNEAGWATYLERSRRGGHLWLFADGKADAGDLASIGSWAIYEAGVDLKEFYPSSRKTSGDYAHLIRLPFGVHRITNERYLFERIEGSNAEGQLAWLARHAQRVDPAKIRDFAKKVRPKRRRKPITPKPTDTRPITGGLVDQIKSVLSILSLAQDLSPGTRWREYQGRYHVGLCPFHDDQHASFWVDADKGICTCYVPECAARQPSGKPMDVINLWAHYRGITNREAIFELAERLNVTQPARETLESVPGLEISKRERRNGGLPLQETRDKFAGWLRETYTDRNTRGKVYLVTLPAGAGKTTTALREANETDVRVHIAWALKQARDEHANSGNLTGWATVDGRSGTTEDEQGRLIQIGNCQEYERAQALGTLGYSVKESLCMGGCPVGITNCDYWRQWHAVGQRNVNFQHEHLRLKTVWEECDVLLIDEDFITRACIDERLITRRMLERSHEGEGASQFIRRILLNALEDVQADIDAGAVDFDDITLATLDLWPYLEAAAGGPEALADALAAADAEIGTSTGEHGLAVLIGAMDREPEEITRLIPPYLFHLVRALMGELTRRRKWPKRTNSQLSLHVDTSGRRRLAYQLITHRTLAELAAGAERMPTVIILDATGDRRYYETVLGCDVEEWTEEIRLPESVEVWQVTTALCGKTGLERVEGARKAAVRKMDFLLALTGGDHTPGLVTFKGQRDDFAEDLGIEPAQHFYNLRGSNQFLDLDLDTLLVYGTPSPPPGQILRLARALHAKSDPIDPTSEKIAGVHVFTDPRAQTLLEVWREREVYQAAFRIRPLQPAANGHGKRLILFSPLDVPRLRPSHVVSSLPRSDTMAAFAGVARAVRELGPDASLRELAKVAGCSAPTAGKYRDLILAGQV